MFAEKTEDSSAHAHESTGVTVETGKHSLKEAVRKWNTIDRIITDHVY